MSIGGLPQGLRGVVRAIAPFPGPGKQDGPTIAAGGGHR